MTALILLIGMLTPPPADAIDEWQRAGSDNVRLTDWWMTQPRWTNTYQKCYAAREIWQKQAAGDLEGYVNLVRYWRAVNPEKKP